MRRSVRSGLGDGSSVGCDPRHGSPDLDEIGRRNGDFGVVRPMDCIDLHVADWVFGIFGVLELCSWVLKVGKSES